MLASAAGGSVRVRHLIEVPKDVTSISGGWAVKDIPPRWCPVYAKTRPNRSGWLWKAAHLQADGQNFTLISFCHPDKGNWKSWLMVRLNGSHSVVARFEHHESHPGLHVHSDCTRSGVEVGGASIDNLPRIPPADRPHRRKNAWTLGTFWNASLNFFRVKPDLGPLYDAS